LIDLKAPYKSAYQEQYSALDVAKKEAKRTRAGAYEFGDGEREKLLGFSNSACSALHVTDAGLSVVC
jgi:hypothetical protein